MTCDLHENLGVLEEGLQSQIGSHALEGMGLAEDHLNIPGLHSLLQLTEGFIRAEFLQEP